VQLHEFETLLFASPSAFELAFPDKEDIVAQVQQIRQQYASPEKIDGGINTHPAERIRRIAPDYQKSVSGPLILKAVGLSTLRRECQHFNSWIERLLAIC
jgi:hypothetical protein